MCEYNVVGEGTGIFRTVKTLATLDTELPEMYVINKVYYKHNLKIIVLSMKISWSLLRFMCIV